MESAIVKNGVFYCPLKQCLLLDKALLAYRRNRAEIGRADRPSEKLHRSLPTLITFE